MYVFLEKSVTCGQFVRMSGLILINYMLFVMRQSSSHALTLRLLGGAGAAITAPIS